MVGRLRTKDQGLRTYHFLVSHFRMRADRRAIALAAVAATALSVFLVRDHTRGDSLSADEPVHILSGYFDVFARNAIVNIEHPPLMKMLAGLALKTLPLPQAPARVPMGISFTNWGREFFFHGPVPPDAIIATARAPFLLLLALLLATVFLWARNRYGDGAALLAVSLLVFDPNLVAHAGVVHTDLGAALTFLLAVIAWENLRNAGPSAANFAAAAVALGLALLTKFSAVYLLPIFLLQGLLAARKEDRPGAAIGHMLGRLAAGLPCEPPEVPEEGKSAGDRRPRTLSGGPGRARRPPPRSLRPRARPYGDFPTRSRREETSGRRRDPCARHPRGPRGSDRKPAETPPAERRRPRSGSSPRGRPWRGAAPEGGGTGHAPSR